MNLLKQLTPLFLWKSLEWTRFLRINFSTYMTLAQRTREDVKYFKVQLFIFFSNYLDYYLVSSGSNLSNLLVNTFIYHHYFDLGQSIQECTKIYLVHSWVHSPIYPCHRDTGILWWGVDTAKSICSARTKFQSETFSRDYIK